eukprot:scaffold2003_cov139-Cylindrotheca_fusiformis.AAC.22
MSFKPCPKLPSMRRQSAMKVAIIFIIIINLKISASFRTLTYRSKATVSLRFNGLEFDDADMNHFVDKLVLEMDSIGIDDEFVRNEYSQWLVRHAKPECETRYKQFKKNLLRQLEYDSKKGMFHRLNEFGDFTEGMYEEPIPESFRYSDHLSIDHLFSSPMVEYKPDATIFRTMYALTINPRLSFCSQVGRSALEAKHPDRAQTHED